MDMETFTDTRDGNTYRVVRIGNQCWMAENLKYLPAVCPATTTPDGDPFHFVYDYQGRNLNEAKATAHYRNYGVLYNWPAALTACPPGWHLPSDAECSGIVDFLIRRHGDLSPATAAYALKAEASPDGEDKHPRWEPAAPEPGDHGLVQTLRRIARRVLDRTPRGCNTDRFGFSALPGGRVTHGGFYRIGELGYWWSSTGASPLRAWCRQMTLGGTVNRWDALKEDGFNIRCVRDCLSASAQL
ncbi:MAG: hypothetical protein MUC65_04520 [Pontiellaceae bacterium]|nr:hypothetical protein [Pontiellaceae bacterium]